MFTVATRDDAFETLELRDSDGGGFALLAPKRGGLLTRLALNRRHLFFLDESTLRDETKNVRGGNPVLFPQPGKLTGEVFVRDGKRGALKQHGFARLFPWEVARTSTENGASATLRLASSHATRALYPWDFVAEYTYTLRPGALRIELAFENTGDDAMPFGAGFHPYFHVPTADKGATRVGTKATRAFDNVTKKERTIEGPIDLTGREVDLHLVDHGPGPCTLTTPKGKLALTASPEFVRWVVWTVSGKDFVCVEPWTCPGDALNTGDALIELAPKERRVLWVEYATS